MFKDWTNSASFFLHKIFKIKQIVYHFHHQIFSNSEPVEYNLNGIFANNYGKIWCWLRNYDNLQEITNSSTNSHSNFKFKGKIKFITVTYKKIKPVHLKASSSSKLPKVILQPISRFLIWMYKTFFLRHWRASKTD